jgi:quercetin dioxygenase-like cupin family protein
LISQLPGEGNRLHYHDDWHEWWYIVKGQWEWEIEGEKFLVKQGDVVSIEKSKWHKITAVGDAPAIRLAVSKDKVAHIYKED